MRAATTRRRSSTSCPTRSSLVTFATYRESVFLERAIVGERIRLTLGPATAGRRPPRAALRRPCRGRQSPRPTTSRLSSTSSSFACNACEDNVYRVTNMCQGCLAHPCREICPKGRHHLCGQEGPYRPGEVHSLRAVRQGLPVPRHSPQGAPLRLRLRHACHWLRRARPARRSTTRSGVSCGQCLINCPFGAIADKSQIFQVIQAINAGDEVIAAVAPAFVGQFGGKGQRGQVARGLPPAGLLWRRGGGAWSRPLHHPGGRTTS
jgi:ferredoxin